LFTTSHLDHTKKEVAPFNELKRQFKSPTLFILIKCVLSFEYHQFVVGELLFLVGFDGGIYFFLPRGLEACMIVLININSDDRFFCSDSGKTNLAKNVFSMCGSSQFCLSV